MYGNQCKAWFEVNARRVNADEVEKIKEAIKSETGLVNMKDPYSNKKNDNEWLLYGVYDSVDEKSELGCKKEFYQKYQQGVIANQILKDKTLKKLFDKADFLFKLQEKYDYKISYTIFFSLQLDIDSPFASNAHSLSLDREIMEFACKIKAFNNIIVEPYYSENN